MAFFSKGETCPYCFEVFRLNDTPFRCTNERCEQEVDAVRERTWRDSSRVGRVLPPVGFSPSELRCGDCGEKSRQRVCPHCHMELPRTIGQFRNLIFAIIGAKASGKSHYIAVLIEQLRRENRLSVDMRSMLVGFGVGWSWAGCIWQETWKNP